MEFEKWIGGKIGEKGNYSQQQVSDDILFRENLE